MNASAFYAMTPTTVLSHSSSQHERIGTPATPAAPKRTVRMTTAFVMEHVAGVYGLPSVEPLLAYTRAPIHSSARHIAMYLARELTTASLPQIATSFHRKDHTTVMYACRRTLARCTTDPLFAASIAKLKTLVTASFADYAAAIIAEHPPSSAQTSYLNWQRREKTWASTYLPQHGYQPPPTLPATPLAPPQAVALPGIPTAFIIDHVAQVHHIPAERLLRSDRQAAIVLTRHLAMYLARELTTASLPQIATSFHRKDHTTVMYACRRTLARCTTDPLFADSVAKLKAAITAAFAAYLTTMYASDAAPTTTTLHAVPDRRSTPDVEQNDGHPSGNHKPTTGPTQEHRKVRPRPSFQLLALCSLRSHLRPCRIPARNRPRFPLSRRTLY